MIKPRVTDIVYLRTGEDRGAKFITAKTTRYKSPPQFELTSGINSSWHYTFEFQYEKPTGKFPIITGLKR
jgi:hypothetical protein